MGVVELDARLLRAGPPAIEAAVGEQVGEPLLLRVDGDWRTAPDPDAVHATLRGIPALTLAIGAPRPLAAAFDLAADDLALAQRWCEAFAGAPHAAVTAALLLRDAHSRDDRDPDRVVWTGLTNESAAYSMLLGSPEFARWRAAHPPRSVDPTDATAPRVAVEQDGPITRITLTRPGRHNAVDARMRDELHVALGEAMARPGPVVLRGDGRSFCSGGDLDTFGTLPDPATAHVVRLARSVAWRLHQLAPRLVVALHGACLGAGIELPAFAGRVVAADDARIGLPELGLGLIPGAGGTVSIARRATPARVLELLLDDGTIPAATAHEWGLADDVVPRAELDERVQEIAESLVCADTT